MEQIVTDQEKYIQHVATRNALFHKGYTNNYSIELVSARIDLPKLKKQRIEGLNVLNDASYSLCDFCIKCLSEIKATGAITVERYVEINTVLKNWRNLIKGGNSFATYDYAAEIIRSIKAFDYPFFERLLSAEFGYIPEAFVGISDRYKYFLRVSCFVPAGSFEEVFPIILDIIKETPLIFNSIERIEVAKNDFPLNTNSMEVFPTFSIIFDYNAVSHPNDPPVSEFISLYNQRTAYLKSDTIYNYAYSKTVGDNLTLSQGFKNYKKYLKLINQLDNVYDKLDNHAFSLMFYKDSNDKNRNN